MLIGYVTPAGQVNEFPPIPSSAGGNETTFDQQFISGPGGDLWFSYAAFDPSSSSQSPSLWPTSQDFIGRVTPAGAVRALPCVGRPRPARGGMYSLAAGADGDLYFTQQIGQHFELERMSQGGVAE